MQVREVKTTQTHSVSVVSYSPFNKENNSNKYSQVVLPPISMMHLHSLEISRLLKGRTRTATFTDDMFKSASKTHTHIVRNRPDVMQQWLQTSPVSRIGAFSVSLYNTSNNQQTDTHLLAVCLILYTYSININICIRY